MGAVRGGGEKQLGESSPERFFDDMDFDDDFDDEEDEEEFRRFRAERNKEAAEWCASA